MTVILLHSSIIQTRAINRSVSVIEEAANLQELKQLEALDGLSRGMNWAFDPFLGLLLGLCRSINKHDKPYLRECAQQLQSIQSPHPTIDHTFL